jgi:epoxide hydrolase 4
MRKSTINVNGINLFTRAMGDPAAHLVLFLHGFPEYSGAWDELMPAFAQRYHAVAPDQRGYAGSDKPQALEAYRLRHLVRDVLGLGDRLSPARPYSLVAHDWGGAVAYAAAIAARHRIARLVVINGVHPGPFQGALLKDDAQRAASAYIHELRHPGAEAQFSENGYAKLFELLGRFGSLAWLTPGKRAGYLEAWAAPGALTGMLNWYRATPLLVPKVGESVPAAAAPRLDAASLRVRVPHLLIWGMDDAALLPASRAQLAGYCDDLSVREIADADHWLVHQKTADVTGLIGEFLRQ